MVSSNVPCQRCGGYFWPWNIRRVDFTNTIVGRSYQVCETCEADLLDLMMKAMGEPCVKRRGPAMEDLLSKAMRKDKEAGDGND